MLRKLRHTTGNKVFASAYEAVKDIPSNSSLLLGGFGIVGVTEYLSSVFSEIPAKGITVYTNTPGLENFGFGKHLNKGQIKKICASYFGANETLKKWYLDGKIEGEFVPQGTLGERIRCGGIGVAGFYTPTGVETMVEHGGHIVKYKKGGKEAEELTGTKPRRYFNGKPYILEPAIATDYAFVKVYKADKKGNVQFRYTTRNFNEDMIMAAKVCIAEAEHIVEVGELKPDEIHMPGIFVDRIVQAKGLEKRIERLMLN